MENLRRKLDPCTSKQKGECTIFGVDSNCNDCVVYQSWLLSKVLGTLSPYKTGYHEAVIDELVV